MLRVLRIIIMLNEVATVAHPIKSTKLTARAKGIRLIVLLRVCPDSLDLEGRQYYNGTSRA